MATTLSMTETIAVTGGTRDQFQKLNARGLLKTNYDEPGQGRARTFTRENVVEMAYVTAFASAGASMAASIAYTAMMVRRDKERKRGISISDFLIFPAGNVTSAVGTNEPEKTLRAAKDQTVHVVVNVQEIFRRIDTAFETVEKRRLEGN
jgi:hypothetical protein